MELNEYKVMYDLERQHTWFRAKRELMIDVFHRFGHDGVNILDIGCGTGVIADYFSRRNNVVGLDVSAEALKFARLRNPSLRWVKGDAQQVRFAANSFDWVFASDVIEHVADDVKALRSMHKVLKKNGKVLITVPALMWLWGKDDDLLHHYRRYTRKQLRAVLERAGFRVVFLNYWNLLMLPAAMVYKRVNKDQSVVALHPWVNRLMHTVLRADTKLVQVLPLPLGVSLVAVAMKM